MITPQRIEVVNAGSSRDVEAAGALPQAATAQIRYSRGFCDALRRGVSVDIHSDILVLNILVLISLPALSWFLVSKYRNYHPFVHAIAIVLFLVIYIAYIRNCLSSETLAYLSNQSDILSINDYVQQVRAAEPSISEEAHCYHFETRTREVSYTDYETDFNGESRSVTKYRTETYEEQVTKHYDTLKINYSKVVDASIIPDLSLHSICFVTSTKDWMPTDSTQSIYRDKKQQFQSKHQTCDTHRSFSTTFTLSGFKAKQLTYLNIYDIPVAIENGRGIFIICTIIPINWIFRVYVTGICGKMTIAFKKVVEVVPN